MSARSRTTPASTFDNASQQPVIAPFWQRLNSFFLFPFQPEPLISMLLLALVSYLLNLPFFIAFFTAIGIVLAASRYAFMVASLASRGVLHSRDYSHHLTDANWKILPWKFFSILLTHSLIINFVFQHSEILGQLLTIFLSLLLLPASLMVLIQSSRLRAALNPFELLATMRSIGMQYLLLCLFLFLLQLGLLQVLLLLPSLVPDWLVLPSVVFAAVYFLWVMASLTGYVMYQHHSALEIDLLREPAPEHTNAAARPIKTQAQLRDAEIAALLQKGDLKEAIAQAREWARTGHDSADDQRRYHRVLLLDDPQSGRLHDHTQRFVRLLLAQKHGPEAVQVHKTVTAKLPGFALQDPAQAIALAESAWKQMNAKQTIAVLRGFDKRFASAEQIPQAYELIIRALKQGLAQGDKALPVYRALQKRYPEHPCTQEAAWVLREELGSG